VAKALAYGLGVDFIEQDVVATRDRELVVLHDIYLDDVSDVAARFPGRARDDGRYYVVDFTLAELGELRLVERRRPGEPGPRFPGRFPYASPEFRVLRFEDEIRLIAGLNATTGGQVGIYPEIKDTGWHEQSGIDLTRLVHAALERARDDLISGRVFVQSFDAGALQRLAGELGSSWPRVQLLGPDEVATLGDDRGVLAAIADYASGVGLPYTALIERRAGGLRPTRLAGKLTEAGLLVHPYTLRRDGEAPEGIDYFAALRFLILELRVDAIFCDQPDDALAVRDGSAA